MRSDKDTKKMTNTTEKGARLVNKQHETFIRNQNTCPLCNSTLEIVAISYLENYTLREEASCPKCHLLARVKDHRMH